MSTMHAPRSRTRSTSPDRTVEATLTVTDGVSVCCLPDTLRYHSAASFARQVELVLADLANHNGRRASGLSDEVARVAPVQAEAISPRGLVRIRLCGATGYHVTVAKAFTLFGESAVAEEVNTALHSANERFVALAAATSATPVRHALPEGPDPSGSDRVRRSPFNGSRSAQGNSDRPVPLWS